MSFLKPPQSLAGGIGQASYDQRAGAGGQILESRRWLLSASWLRPGSGLITLLVGGAGAGRRVAVGLHCAQEDWEQQCVDL